MNPDEQEIDLEESDGEREEEHDCPIKSYIENYFSLITMKVTFA